MAQIFQFDGGTKTINLQNTDSFTMEELYSRWKDWVLTDDNAKYFQAFRYVGGDPTVGDNSLGVTYFLTNGWKIKPFDEDHVLDVYGNLYVDGGGNPFLLSNVGKNILVRQNVSNLVDAKVIQGSVDQDLAYGEFVHIDTENGYLGSNYPVGTSARPAKLLSDAIIIAERLGIHRFRVSGILFLSQTITNYTIEGETDKDIIVFQSDVPVCSLVIREMIVTGEINDCGTMMVDPTTGEPVEGLNFTTFKDCTLYNIKNLMGFALRCGMVGEFTLVDDNIFTSVDCFCMLPSVQIPTFDFQYSNGSQFFLRRWAGQSRIINLNDSEAILNIVILGGNLGLPASNILGTLRLNGVGYLNDQSGPNLTVVRDAFVQAKELTDLYTVHGLDPKNPMEVSKTQRTAGSITQAIQQIDDKVKLTRTP